MVAAKVLHHLIAQMVKKGLPPLDVTVLIQMYDPEDAAYLLLDLHLTSLQLRCLRYLPLRCCIDVLWDVFEVMIFVEDVEDVRVVFLKDRKGIAVAILDHSCNLHIHNAISRHPPTKTKRSWAHLNLMLLQPTCYALYSK